MKENNIIVNGLNIKCYEYNAHQTKSIFFIHGNSSSSAVWRKQVHSGLFNQYRLITLDLPSHGKSDELPVLADFSLPAIASIIAAAVKQHINDQPYLIYGISLGTNIIAEMLLYGLTPLGLLLAGPCIAGEGFELDKMMLPSADVSAVFADNVPQEIVNKYAGETSLSLSDEDRKYFLEDYNAVKGLFRTSLFATIAAGTYNDQIAIIKKINCPVCLVFGKDDKIVNTDYLNAVPFNIWNNQIYKVDGASHLVNIDAPVEFNKLLFAFAKDIFNSSLPGSTASITTSIGGL